MASRAALAAALVATPLLAWAAQAQAQTLETPVCSTREDAQMLIQSARGAALPEGCRIATVRRLDTPAGALCQIDINTQGGVLGAVREAVTNSQWWTACANLRAP